MRLKEFCSIRMGHSFRERLTHVWAGGMKVIQPKNITTGGDLFFEHGEAIQTDASVSKPLEQGDVLVVNRGRFVATVFEHPDNGAWIVPSSIIILSVKKESVLPEYVALYFNSINGQRLFRRHYEQTTVPFISTRNLANMDIPIPPLKKQRALIDLEGTSRKYAQLSNRKQELQRQILSHVLTKADQST